MTIVFTSHYKRLE